MRLLFLTRAFPPVSAVGCIRSSSIATYLSQLGWDVAVVTADPGVFRYVEATPPLPTPRILTGHAWRCLEPERLHCYNRGVGWLAGGIARTLARRLGVDPAIGWISAAERACAHLEAKDVDVIVASGPPFAAFMLARRLADHLKRPYVLDYRDPWTLSPHAARPAPSHVIRMEARLLANAAAVTIVSPSWASAMDRAFRLGPKLHVVTNGYDPAEFADVIPHVFDHFAIVYAGTFYPPKRVITPVFEALTRVRRDDWRFHYYGPQPEHVRQEAMRLGLTGRVVLHGRVPRAEAVAAVRGARVAVVITSVLDTNGPEDAGIVPGKIFEALTTPILLVAPAGTDARMIVEETKVSRGFSGVDVVEMAAFIEALMARCPPAPESLEDYAWPKIARRLHAVLRSVVD